VSKNKKDRATALESTVDIRKQWDVDPMFQRRVSVAPSTASGAVELAWYRGHQSGALEAFNEIAEKVPSIRKKFSKILEYSLDDE
jgi:hypothetical protein